MAFNRLCFLYPSSRHLLKRSIGGQADQSITQVTQSIMCSSQSYAHWASGSSRPQRLSTVVS